MQVWTFSRRPHENVDSFLSRFVELRYRAAREGHYMMSVEGWAWMLLRQLPIGQTQVMTLLEPFNHVMPGNEQELDTLISRIRRLGHQYENRPGSLPNLLGIRMPADGRGHFHALADEEPTALAIEAPPTFMMNTNMPGGQQLAVPGGWNTWNSGGYGASGSSAPSTTIFWGNSGTGQSGHQDAYHA